VAVNDGSVTEKINEIGVRLWTGCGRSRVARRDSPSFDGTAAKNRAPFDQISG
jgi:hypothetical protein